MGKLDVDNIKFYLKDITHESVDWIYLAEDTDQRRVILKTLTL